MKPQRIVREPYESWESARSRADWAWRRESDSAVKTQCSAPAKSWNLEPFATWVEIGVKIGAVLGIMYFLYVVSASAMDLIWRGAMGELIRLS